MDIQKKSPVLPVVEVDKDYNPFKNSGTKKSAFRKESKEVWESLCVGLKDDDEDSLSITHNFAVESDEVTGKLFDDGTNALGKVTFQLQQKYIVTSIKSGLMIIHQNLAHQRILYEDLLKSITVQEAVSQQLLFPLSLSFTKPEMTILLSLKEQLEHAGFVFSTLKTKQLEITGIPVGVTESKVSTILEQLLADFEREVPDAGFNQNDLLAKSLAKSMAIKTGAVLEPEAQEHLIHQLFACKEPSFSPDQKRVLITMDVNDFDKKFA